MDEDPVALVQAAAREHIPLNPKQKSSEFGDIMKRPIPDHDARPSIDEVLTEIQEEDWYKNQIVDRRIFEAREGQTSKNDLSQLLQDGSI